MNLFVLRTWLQAKFTKDERGASMVEYILLVALIALAVIAAVVFLRGQVSDKFNDAGSKVSASSQGPSLTRSRLRTAATRPLMTEGLRTAVRGPRSRRKSQATGTVYAP